MLKTLALTSCLGLALAAPLAAETYTDPDRAWWTGFLDAVDGRAPDLEALARQDPDYLASDEFTRDAVLARVMARLQAQQPRIDPATAEVVLSIGATLGDFDAGQGGFPVSIFTPNSRLPLDSGRELFFRNWKDVALYPASREEGRALRQEIGMREILAQVTVTEIRKSATRRLGYEGRVTGISYYTQDGSLLRRVTPPEAAPVDAAAAEGNLDALRGKILSDARIPALGTRWEDAAPALTADWPVIASDDFVPYGTARQLAFLWQDGAVLSDNAHDPEKSFKVFLQQVPGAWMPQDGVSIDVTDVLYGSGAGVVDTRALGPGLACYTPGVPDRCAVLVFAPGEGSHVLTGAYGVLEQPAAAAPEAAFRAYAGAAAEAFTGLETMADYDSEAVCAGDRVPHPGSRGVPTYAAGAGAEITGKPIYDPLKNTTDVNPIARELALYAIGGAEDRTPMVFVMGR